MSLNFAGFSLLLNPVQDTGLVLQRCSDESCSMIILKTVPPIHPDNTDMLLNAAIRSNIANYFDSRAESPETMAHFRTFLVAPPKDTENFSSACIETKLLNRFWEERMVKSTCCFFHKGSLPSETGLRRLRSEAFLLLTWQWEAWDACLAHLGWRENRLYAYKCFWQTKACDRRGEIPFVSNAFKT